jgi:hypothetical protein
MMQDITGIYCGLCGRKIIHNKSCECGNIILTLPEDKEGYAQAKKEVVR